MSSSNKGLLHTETGGYKKTHWSQDKVTDNYVTTGFQIWKMFFFQQLHLNNSYSSLKYKSETIKESKHTLFILKL